MGRYEDQLAQSPIHPTIQAILVHLENAKDEALSDVAMDIVARSIGVIGYVRDVLDNIDPMLISFNLLTGINSHLVKISAGLNNFNNDKNDNHLNSLEPLLDGALDMIKRIQMSPIDDKGTGLTEAIRASRMVCNNAVTDLRKQKENLEKTLDHYCPKQLFS